MNVLSVAHLTKTFSTGLWPLSKPHSYTAVRDVSFELARGEILGVLGPNGAGKTTTIQMLLGTLTPTTGSISYFSQPFAQHRTDILQRVTYASGYDKLPARLTILENLDVVGRIYQIPTDIRNERMKELLTLFGMWNMRHKETGSLSAGQATRVMLVKAFLPNPDVVLLDEPTASLDPDVAHEVRQFILQQQRERSISILLTSHNMAEVSEVCDRVLVLKQGTIIANSTPEQLAQSVSQVRINLVIPAGYETIITYLTTQDFEYTLHAHSIDIMVDEQAIAHLLSALARHEIHYSHIAIYKPTLEDYFLSVAKP